MQRLSLGFRFAYLSACYSIRGPSGLQDQSHPAGARSAMYAQCTRSAPAVHS